ncbi:siderophore-interacting protein [Hellea balneolensis]|uniref:siderophore-interacting protein n=1 Tax=Hellea balneolensis TaxID=287478 RepID=UPI000414E878|nr:siderophore-interacting protein [Hellea balneolensis]
MKHLNIALVTGHNYISPNMIRITLQSEAIKSFPANATGGHIKLIIPQPEHNSREFQKFLRSFGVRKRMRTYTVRHLNLQSGEIDIDFVAHGDDGPASAWALSAKLGDFIGLSSPGSPKLKPSQSGRYLVAVDMTAFPAAAAGLEGLSSDSTGDVYAEILSEKDIQPVNAPDGIKLHWIINSAPHAGSAALTSAIRNHSLTGDESVFVAGEYEAVGDLRTYFRKEQGYAKDQLYISSYWKRGLIESEHKRVKTLVA